MELITLLIFGMVSVLQAEAEYAVCGSSSPIDRRLLEKYIGRLMSERSSEVLLSVQLVDSAGYHVINSTTDWLRSTIRQVNARGRWLQVGTLAYHAMATMSICEDPRTFGDVNMIRLIEQAIHKQFHHCEEPRDGWYSYALAVQALCIARASPHRKYIKKILNSQKNDGSFDNAPDTTAQISIALLCARDMLHITHPMRERIDVALVRAKAFLSSELTSDESNLFIGNRVSSPEALLALYEMQRDEVTWFCNLVAKSTLRRPRSWDPQAFITRSLQALGGASVLKLRNGWTCNDEGQMLGRYTPLDTPTFTRYCPPAVDHDDFLLFPISVSLTVVADGHRTSMTPHHVTKDESLFKILLRAECDGLLTFKYEKTLWGPMLTSVNRRRARVHEREFWALIDGKTGQLYDVGMAGLLPADGDDVVIKLMTY